MAEIRWNRIHYKNGIWTGWWKHFVLAIWWKDAFVGPQQLSKSVDFVLVNTGFTPPEGSPHRLELELWCLRTQGVKMCRIFKFPFSEPVKVTVFSMYFPWDPWDDCYIYLPAPSNRCQIKPQGMVIFLHPDSRNHLAPDWRWWYTHVFLSKYTIHHPSKWSKLHHPNFGSQKAPFKKVIEWSLSRRTWNGSFGLLQK